MPDDPSRTPKGTHLPLNKEMNGRMNASAACSANNPDITDTSPCALGTCAIHSAATAVGHPRADGCLVMIG